MKKLFILFMMALISVQIFGQKQIKVASANVNFRQSPTVSGNIICVIPKGTSLLVEVDDDIFNSWKKVTFNGKEGYIHSEYLVNPGTINYNLSDNNSTQNVKYYINSKGERVQSPTYYKSPPRGATAECRDGTYSLAEAEGEHVHIMEELKDGSIKFLYLDIYHLTMFTASETDRTITYLLPHPSACR